MASRGRIPIRPSFGRLRIAVVLPPVRIDRSSLPFGRCYSSRSLRFSHTTIGPAAGSDTSTMVPGKRLADQRLHRGAALGYHPRMGGRDVVELIGVAVQVEQLVATLIGVTDSRAEVPAVVAYADTRRAR